MLILTIKTDESQAEITLFDNDQLLEAITWEAHRQLADTIHVKINAALLVRNKTLHDLHALAVFKGPGSFTGLRIGASLANALAYSLSIPIVARQGTNWRTQAVTDLLNGANDQIVIPDYGSQPHITQPKR